MMITAQSDQRDERVSALMDGEIDGSDIDRALSDLKQDAELSARWNRYHLVSDSLHNDLASQVDPQLADRISEQIAAEPIYTSADHWGKKPSPAWLKQAGGLAIAASVTAVAILGTQALYQDEIGSNPAIADAGPPGAASTSASPRKLPENFELAAYRQPPSSPLPPARFNQLLLNHQELQAGSTLPGRTLPYIRLFNSENPP